jgi:hypothetical protein
MKGFHPTIVTFEGSGISGVNEDNPFKGAPNLSYFCFWEYGLLMPPTTCNRRTI